MYLNLTRFVHPEPNIAQVHFADPSTIRSASEAAPSTLSTSNTPAQAKIPHVPTTLAVHHTSTPQRQTFDWRHAAGLCMAAIGAAAVIAAILVAAGRADIHSVTTAFLANGHHFLPTSGSCVSDVSKLPRSLVTRALPVGRHDYALGAHGAQVASKLTTPHRSASSLSPDTVLSDDFRIDGCWNVGSSQGQIGIVLYEPIWPTHITIDHVPQSLTTNTGQAPRIMIVWGVVDKAMRKDQYSHLLADSPIVALHNHSEPLLTNDFIFLLLAGFEYDIHGEHHVQTFPVFSAIVESYLEIGIIVVEFLSNWGADDTCLYRIRIHGEQKPFIIPLLEPN